MMQLHDVMCSVDHETKKKRKKKKKTAFLLTFYKKERSLGRQNVLFFLPMGVHDKDLTLKVLTIVQKWQSKV